MTRIFVLSSNLQMIVWRIRRPFRPAGFCLARVFPKFVDSGFYIVGLLRGQWVRLLSGSRQEENSIVHSGGFTSDAVRTTGTAVSPVASASSHATLPTVSTYDRFYSSRDGTWRPSDKESVVGESSRLLSSDGHSSSPVEVTLRTARKASCGMSTWPTRFMRFLPSFCFSRSLRLREMSPP